MVLFWSIVPVVFMETSSLKILRYILLIFLHNIPVLPSPELQNLSKLDLPESRSGEQADFLHQYQLAIPTARAWRVITWMKVAWSEPEESSRPDCVLLLTCVHLTLFWPVSFHSAEPHLACQALNLKLFNSRDQFQNLPAVYVRSIFKMHFLCFKR